MFNIYVGHHFTSTEWYIILLRKAGTIYSAIPVDHPFITNAPFNVAVYYKNGYG